MINIDEVETNLAFMQFDYFRSKIYIYMKFGKFIAKFGKTNKEKNILFHDR